MIVTRILVRPLSGLLNVAIEDVARNDFAGISGNVTRSFTTESSMEDRNEDFEGGWVGETAAAMNGTDDDDTTASESLDYFFLRIGVIRN